MNNIIPAQRGEHWEIIDVGLQINQRENRNFWRKDEMVVGCATINGVGVEVMKCSGRMGGSRDLYSVRINGRAVESNVLLYKEDAIEIIDNIRTPTGDYIDAEYGD